MMTADRPLGERVGAAWEEFLRHVPRADFPTDELRDWFDALGSQLGGRAAPIPSAAIAAMNGGQIAEAADLIRDLCLRTVKAHAKG